MSNFDLANESALELASNEFKYAYSTASDVYLKAKLPLSDRIFAFKIVLFCERMLNENCEQVWEFEIIEFFQIPAVKNAIKARMGNDYQAIVEFSSTIRIVLDSTTVHFMSGFVLASSQSPLRCLHS